MVKIGRPTDYSPDLIRRVGEYLDNLRNPERFKKHLPTKYGFAQYIGVNEDTLNEWTKKYPDFSAAIKEIEKTQQVQLMNDGLYNKDANATMAIFLLKANHGMIETERRLTDITSGGKPIPILGGVTTTE